jgi:hypothetical protein
MTEIEKVVALQEFIYQPGGSVTGLHFEPGDDLKVRIIFSNDTVITVRLADLEISKLRAE